jgi:hypothetical protein
LYSQTEFAISGLSTFTAFAAALLPQRLDKIRILHLTWHYTEYEEHGHRLAPYYLPSPIDKRWLELCKMLAGMSLSRLHVQLIRDTWMSPPVWDVELLRPLQSIHGLDKFEVEVSWNMAKIPHGEFNVVVV